MQAHGPYKCAWFLVLPVLTIPHVATGYAAACRHVAAGQARLTIIYAVSVLSATPDVDRKEHQCCTGSGRERGVPVRDGGGAAAGGHAGGGGRVEGAGAHDRADNHAGEHLLESTSRAQYLAQLAHFSFDISFWQRGLLWSRYPSLPTATT